MAVVYRHRRLDTNEVFYVGIGEKEKRAYKKSNRTSWWKSITNKSEYEVEFLARNISIEDAEELEILLISEYGRKDLGTGCLINMTSGGEGTNGWTPSKEFRENVSKVSSRPVKQFDIDDNFIKEHKSLTEAAREVNCTPSFIGQVCRGVGKTAKGFKWEFSNPRKTPVNKAVNKPNRILQYDLEGNLIKKFSSVGEVSRETGFAKSSIALVCNYNRSHLGNYIFRYEKDKNKVEPFDKNKLIKRRVSQYTKEGEFIKEYESLSQAERETGVLNSKICLVCKGKRKIAGGFVWKYKDK